MPNIEFPERFRMGDYFLYHNLEEGRGGKVCLYYGEETFTYADAARYLLPRAVGYSAALYDYFFREQIEITAPGRFVYGKALYQPDKAPFGQFQCELRLAVLQCLTSALHQIVHAGRLDQRAEILLRRSGIQMRGIHIVPTGVLLHDSVDAPRHRAVVGLEIWQLVQLIRKLHAFANLFQSQPLIQTFHRFVVDIADSLGHVGERFVNLLRARERTAVRLADGRGTERPRRRLDPREQRVGRVALNARAEAPQRHRQQYAGRRRARLKNGRRSSWIDLLDNNLEEFLLPGS